MKTYSTAMAAALVATLFAAGCNTAMTPRAQRMALTPAIMMDTPQVIGAGTSTRVVAATENVVAPLDWACTPNDGKLTIERDTNGQSAIFTSNAPGTYRITTSARGANGQVVQGQTEIRVEPRPMTITNERIVEPAPR